MVYGVDLVTQIRQAAGAAPPQAIVTRPSPPRCERYVQRRRQAWQRSEGQPRHLRFEFGDTPGDGCGLIGRQVAARHGVDDRADGLGNAWRFTVSGMAKLTGRPLRSGAMRSSTKRAGL